MRKKEEKEEVKEEAIHLFHAEEYLIYNNYIFPINFQPFLYNYSSSSYSQLDAIYDSR